MPNRLYISRMIGDGLTPQTAFRPIWMDAVTPVTRPIKQVSDTNRYSYWIGVLDLTAEQHTILSATPGVWRLPRSLLATRLDQLSAGIRSTLSANLIVIGASIGIFGIEATVADVVALLTGRAMWQIAESDE